MITVNVYSAWVDGIPGQITQPDGTVIDVLFSGDEFHVWAHDEEGFTIIQDETTGFWCWAVLGNSECGSRNDELISSGSPIHLYTAESLDIRPRLNISPQRHLELRNEFESSSRDLNVLAPSTGVINNLVIFIRFSDDTEFTTPLSFYEEMFNCTESLSQRQYFLEASYGQLEVNSHFFPIPNGDNVHSFRSPHPRAYFQPFNAITNPIGYQDLWERMERQVPLIVGAINHVRPHIPTTLNIDADNDGWVDNICFIVRGGTMAWAELLWPHMSSLANWYDVFINDKRVGTYNFNIENHIAFSGVGVLVHEFVHTMGVPDYYRYGFDGTPVGFWCIMSTPSRPSQSVSALVKSPRHLNWIPTIPTISISGEYTLYPLTTSQNQSAFRINGAGVEDEYFIIEYRSTETGVIDSALPGSGLLVYRINPHLNGNAQGPPDEAYIFRPNGTLTTE